MLRSRTPTALEVARNQQPVFASVFILRGVTMAQGSALRAVTFDFWGTLVDSRYSRTAERVAYLHSRLEGYTQERVLDAYRQSEASGSQIDALGFSLGVPARVSLTLDILGAALRPEALAATVRFWEETMLDDPPQVLEGVPETLENLRGRGLALAIISDTGFSPGRVLRQILAMRGILGLFDYLTFSNETGVTKRRPQAFTSTLAALGVAPREALHVGDLPTTDIRGAHAVGMRTALLLQNNPHPEGIPLADLVLNHIRELPEALASLE